MTDPEALLEAHVAFVLARWSGEGLSEAVAAHVTAVREWLETVTVADLAPAEPTAAVIGQWAAELSFPDELVAFVADVAASGHTVLAEHPGLVGDLVAAADYDAVVALVAEQEELRREVIAALTGSKAYRRLVSHVLYQGLKAYLLTENLIARKVPGASSLVRLGQRGLTSAAPKLEAGLDRRLTAFVETNLGETLRESRRYLESTLDPQMLGEMADEAWSSVEERSLGSLTGMLDPEVTRVLVTLIGPVLRRWQEAGLLAEVAEAVVLTVLTDHAEDLVGPLLESWELPLERWTEQVVELLRPAWAGAVASGLLESRVRAELEPFYATLRPAPAARKPRSRTPR